MIAGAIVISIGTLQIVEAFGDEANTRGESFGKAGIALLTEVGWKAVGKHSCHPNKNDTNTYNYQNTQRSSCLILTSPLN